MSDKTESVCKTREAAKRGERDRPHYYVDSSNGRQFVCVPGPSFKLGFLYYYPKWAMSLKASYWRKPGVTSSWIG